MRSVLLLLFASGCVFTPPGAVGTVKDAAVDAGQTQDAGAEDAAVDAGVDDVGVDAGQPQDAAAGPIFTTVQTGSVTISNLVDVTQPMMAPVALDRAFLLFTYTVDSTEPSNGQVRGSLRTNQSVGFARASAGPSGRVVWSVVEMAPGGRVQRGQLLLPDDNSDEINIPISQVPLDRSFILASLSKGGSTYDQCDYLRWSFASPTSVEVAVEQNSLDGTLDWQVVTLPSGHVEHGEADLTGDERSVDVTVPAYDPASSFLLISWGVNQGNPLIGPHAIRATMTSSTTVTFHRTVGGGDAAIRFSLVSLDDGSRVLHGTERLGTVATSADVPLAAPVDPDRAFSFDRGSSPLEANDNEDNIGVVRHHTELVGRSTLRIGRGSVQGGVSRSSWFVIEAAQ